MMAKKKRKFSKTVYVTRDYDLEDDEILITHTNVDNIDEETVVDEEVAVYELVGVRKIRVTRTLE
jgi:predicted metal-dependent TIM-barrel fold hydrolase